MIIRLPFPAPGLFPNRKNGRSWKGSQDAKTTARDGAWALTKQAKGAWKDPGGAIPLSLIFVAPDGYHRDLDNCLAASKSMLDGLALGLGGIDDERFRPIILDYIKGSKPGALIVTVGVRITTSSNL